MYWQVVGQLQLHCLSMLNARFIPCVCAFTYLSSSIIFTSSSSRPCCSVVNHAREHVSIAGHTQISGTRVRQMWGKMLDTYNTYMYIRGLLSRSMWGSLRLAPRIHGAYQGIHGSQEPGCDKYGVKC